MTKPYKFETWKLKAFRKLLKKEEISLDKTDNQLKYLSNPYNLT
jgi:hypothetical protein